MTKEEQIEEKIKNNTEMLHNKIIKDFINQYVLSCLQKSKRSFFKVDLKWNTADSILSLKSRKELSYARDKYEKDDFDLIVTYLNKNVTVFNIKTLSDNLNKMSISNEKDYGKYIFMTKVNNVENIIDEITKPTIEPRFNKDLIDYAENKKNEYNYIYNTKINDFRELLDFNLRYLIPILSHEKRFIYQTFKNVSDKYKKYNKNEKYLINEVDKKIVYIYNHNYSNYLPVVLDDLIESLENKGLEVTRDGNIIFLNKTNRRILK